MQEAHILRDRERLATDNLFSLRARHAKWSSSSTATNRRVLFFLPPPPHHRFSLSYANARFGASGQKKRRGGIIKKGERGRGGYLLRKGVGAARERGGAGGGHCPRVNNSSTSTTIYLPTCLDRDSMLMRARARYGAARGEI